MTLREGPIDDLAPDQQVIDPSAVIRHIANMAQTDELLMAHLNTAIARSVTDLRALETNALAARIEELEAETDAADTNTEEGSSDD